jgi:uncharacterized membrane protein
VLRVGHARVLLPVGRVLLLVLVVATGVALLSLLGWLSDLLSVAGAAGVVITLVIAGAIMIAEVRKRTDKQKTTS